MTKTGLSREADRHRPLTAADRLRAVLDDLESAVGALGYSRPDEALAIPKMLDEAADLLSELKARGGTWQAEEVRLKSVLAQLERQAARYLAVVGRARLADARPPDTPPARWWWYVERVVADQRRAQRDRLLRIAALVLVIFAALALIYRQFLAPDPAVVERVSRVGNAELYASEGDYAAAVEEIHLAQTAVPDDPTLWVMEGVYLEAAGDEQAADRLYGQAKNAMASEAEFLLQRAQVYMRVNQPETALEDVLLAIEREPDSGVAYYLKGSIEASLGRLQEAYNSLLRAAELADQAGDTRLSGLARVQLAYLTQQMMVPRLEATGTP
ncbi:MAG: hypothetical protein Kow0077_31470 [Anaerolineae bacterium]